MTCARRGQPQAGEAILLQSNFAPDPWNLDRHNALGATIIHAAVTKAASRHRPELVEPLSQLLADAALTEEVDEVLAMDRSFLEWDEAAFRIHSEKELTGAPFGDAAPDRIFSFGVLGQQWRVQCRNEPIVVTAAEEFCAAAQHGPGQAGPAISPESSKPQCHEAVACHVPIRCQGPIRVCVHQAL